MYVLAIRSILIWGFAPLHTTNEALLQKLAYPLAFFELECVKVIIPKMGFEAMRMFYLPLKLLAFYIYILSTTFTSIARLTTICAVLVLEEQKGVASDVEMDLKFTSLNRNLKENMYIEQPLGFVILGSKSKVYKLCRMLYWLK